MESWLSHQETYLNKNMTKTFEMIERAVHCRTASRLISVKFSVRYSLILFLFCSLISLEEIPLAKAPVTYAAENEVPRTVS